MSYYDLSYTHADYAVRTARSCIKYANEYFFSYYTNVQQKRVVSPRINRILKSCVFNVEFIELVEARFIPFYSTHSINSLIQYPLFM